MISYSHMIYHKRMQVLTYRIQFVRFNLQSSVQEVIGIETTGNLSGYFTQMTTLVNDPKL
jgi:hypothetical protein